MHLCNNDSNVLQVTWFFEDEPITSGPDLIIETTEVYTSLRIQVNLDFTVDGTKFGNG